MPTSTMKAYPQQGHIPTVTAYTMNAYRQRKAYIRMIGTYPSPRQISVRQSPPSMYAHVYREGTYVCLRLFTTEAYSCEACIHHQSISTVKVYTLGRSPRLILARVILWHQDWKTISTAKASRVKACNLCPST